MLFFAPLTWFLLWFYNKFRHTSSSKQIWWLLSLSRLPSVSSPTCFWLPLWLLFLLFSLPALCKHLNHDRHCLSVVMTTIWRSLSVANCPADLLFSCCQVSPLHCCSLSMCLTLEYFSHSCTHADGDDKERSPRWQKSMVNELWNSFIPF